MMTGKSFHLKNLFIAVFFVLFASCVIGIAQMPSAANTTLRGIGTTSPQLSESERLRNLFAASDEANLKRNPIRALVRGDFRYADRFGDYLSDEYFAAEKAAAESDLAALKTIKRSALSPGEQISYDAFIWQTEINLRGYRPDILRVTVFRPIDQSSIQSQMPDISSGS